MKTEQETQVVNLNFRKMVPDDASAVEFVEKACFKIPWSREAFWREASNDKAYYLLSLDGEQVIGYVGMWILLDEAQITNVALLPKYRGQGLGRKMMEKIIFLAKTRGATAMTLEVRPSNLVAINLYESLGFKSVGTRRGYYEDTGEDALIMWLTSL